MEARFVGHADLVEVRHLRSKLGRVALRHALIRVGLHHPGLVRVHRVPRREDVFIERLLAWLRSILDGYPDALLQTLRDVLRALTPVARLQVHIRPLSLSLVPQEEAEILGDRRELIELNLLVHFLDGSSVAGLVERRREAVGVQESGLRLKSRSPIDQDCLLIEKGWLSAGGCGFCLLGELAADIVDHIVSGLHHLALGHQVH